MADQTRDIQMCASNIHQPPRIGPHEYKRCGGREREAYGVGEVDVLVGARLDELAADEEAHPWLRGIEKQQDPQSIVSRDGWVGRAAAASATRIGKDRGRMGEARTQQEAWTSLRRARRGSKRRRRPRQSPHSLNRASG